MAERASLATSNPVGTPGLITAEDMRYGIGAGFYSASRTTARSGFKPAPGDPGKVTASGTADKLVHVASFQRVQQSVRGGGVYVQTLDATEDINVLDTQPAHSSGITKHLIIAQQNDVQFGDADSEFRVRLVLGASGTNTDPDVSAYPDHVPLARLNIAANALTVTSAMIEDLRPTTSLWTVALGGILPIASLTERDALTGTRWDGMAIYRQDRDWVEVYDGTAFRVQGTAVCSSTADRDSAITHPYNGQLAATTDTGTLWLRQAGTWRALMGTSAGDTQVTAGTTTSTTYTTTLTGGTKCGLTFVAPASGTVVIHNTSEVINSSPPNLTLVTLRVRAGAVIGAGADVLVPSDDEALIGTTDQRMTTAKRITALTPWATYNAEQLFRVTGGTGTCGRKSLIVVPV